MDGAEALLDRLGRSLGGLGRALIKG
jgi:hypothetical protein